MALQQACGIFAEIACTAAAMAFCVGLICGPYAAASTALLVLAIGAKERLQSTEFKYWLLTPGSRGNLRSTHANEVRAAA